MRQHPHLMHPRQQQQFVIQHQHSHHLQSNLQQQPRHQQLQTTLHSSHMESPEHQQQGIYSTSQKTVYPSGTQKKHKRPLMNQQYAVQQIYRDPPHHMQQQQPQQSFSSSEEDLNATQNYEGKYLVVCDTVNNL